MGLEIGRALARTRGTLAPGRTPVRAQNKQSLEIERLLHWAFRDELTKRHSSCAEGIWDRITSGDHFGSIHSVHTPQRYDFGVPHPDAETIEAAIAGIPPFKIDWQRDGKRLMADARYGEGLWLLLRARDVILDDVIDAAHLVRHYAVMMTRPKWDIGCPEPGPSIPEGGNKPMLVGECRGKNLYSAGSYMPLRYEPSPITIAHARADYAAWRFGLTQLAATLELSEHVALAPAAAEEPWWEGERAGEIFIVAPREPLKPLPLKQRGPLALRAKRFRT
jgi:hypothetical protein